MTSFLRHSSAKHFARTRRVALAEVVPNRHDVGRDGIRTHDSANPRPSEKESGPGKPKQTAASNIRELIEVKAKDDKGLIPPKNALNGQV